MRIREDYSKLTKALSTNNSRVTTTNPSGKLLPTIANKTTELKEKPVADMVQTQEMQRLQSLEENALQEIDQLHE